MAEFWESYAIWGIWIIYWFIFLTFSVMSPCHAVFLLPFAGLPLFWLLPLGYALSINIAVWLAAPFLFRVIRKTMRKPVQDGFQSLIGTEATVVSRLASDGSIKYLIRSQGELWSAYSTDTLQSGEPVKIVAVKGIGVVVERAEPTSHPGEINNTKTIVSGAEDNRQHHH